MGTWSTRSWLLLLISMAVTLTALLALFPGD